MKLFLFLSLLLFSLLQLSFGEVPWAEAWAGAILRLQGEISWTPLLDERLPRLIVLLSTGGSLAVSGAVMQSLFHNPLASPGLLGIASGGSLALLAVYLLQWHIQAPLMLPLAAILGCFLTLLLVYLLARRGNLIEVHMLLLTGIAISSSLMAIQNAILYFYRDQWSLMQVLTEWQAGSSFNRSWTHVHMQLPLTLVGLWVAWLYRRELNILALGDEEAKNMGVEVEAVRFRLFLAVALLTGGALAGMGVIAFFGLLVPHLFRRITGPNHLRLIPLCMGGGALSLLMLDLSLRSFGLYSLTIGNISAILGSIFFLFLLTERQKSYARTV